MKKIYLPLLCCFFLAACLCVSQAFAQTTVTIYATGITGSYITGTGTSIPTRTDGNIVSTGATSRGYAVFNLGSIPAGATVTSCIIGFNVSTYAGGGTASGWDTYGYPGDLSTVTVPATLFADMAAGTSLSTASYGGFAGNQTLASTVASIGFVQLNIGSNISICWTGGNTRVYTITGEGGTAATTGTHAPYLKVTYTCAGVSGVTATAAPNPLCVGAALTLTGSGTGTTAYSWAGPGGYTSAAQSTSFNTTAASGGVYTLTAYNGSGCGTQATTSSVALSPTPVATVSASGSLVFCTGGSVLLTGTAGAGYTYQWYDSGSPISGETNQSYNAINGGSYTTKITAPDGCASTSAPSAVAILPASISLTPAGISGVCIGSFLTLSVDLSGITTGMSYQWEKGGAVISGATNSNYSTSTGGDYDCILSVPACSITTAVTTVNVLSLPVPVVTRSGSTLATGLYTDYQWFLNLTAIPGATSASFSPAVNGNYRVRVTDGGGCTNYSAPYLLYNLGVNQAIDPAIKIYPNPASKTIHIESAVPVRVVISGIEGKKLLEKANAADIDISGLPNGLYIIMLYNEAGERIAIDKLIKE